MQLANNMNLDEIEEALVMERANAEMTYSTNSEVMQAYSERNREAFFLPPQVITLLD